MYVWHFDRYVYLAEMFYVNVYSVLLVFLCIVRPPAPSYLALSTALSGSHFKYQHEFLVWYSKKKMFRYDLEISWRILYLSCFCFSAPRRRRFLAIDFVFAPTWNTIFVQKRSIWLQQFSQFIIDITHVLLIHIQPWARTRTHSFQRE